MAKKKFSKNWIHQHINDPYVKLAQQQGYRARAAYKLSKEGQSGCKTVFDIAPAYLSAKSGDELRASLL